MEGRFICHENETLTYDYLYTESSKVEEESEISISIENNDGLEKNIVKKQDSKEEIENILKESIENMVTELEDIIDEKFRQYNLITKYNRNTINWNEVLCSIESNKKLIEIKLTNDYMCDDNNNISSVYITLFSGGKGIFTECIERISQEYEFIGSNYAYVPRNESQLSFKKLNKDKFIEFTVAEINKMI